MPVARHYAFTVWPKNLLQHDTLEAWFDFVKTKTAGVTYLVMQHEHGTKEGGHHVQGFITAATKKRPSTLGNQFQVQPEAFQLMQKKSNPQKNRAYCTDDTKRLTDTEFFEYGTVPGEVPHKLEEMCELVRTQGLKRAFESDPATYVRNYNGLKDLELQYKRQRLENRIDRQVTVFVLWGTSGSGKTHFARHFDPESTFPLPDIDKGSRLNIDNYNNQRTLVIEDYEGEIPYRSLVKMLDIFNAEFHTKGAYDGSNWNWVIITSNTHPNSWYDDRKDPWGMTPPGPLERRISTLVHTQGVYPNSTFTWTTEGEWVTRTADEMPNLEELMAYHDEGNGAEGAPQEPVAEPAASNAVPIPPEVPVPPESDFLQQLQQDFVQQDEYEANDFLRGVDLSGQGDPFDPDGLTFGFDGDVEPARGINLLQ